MSFNPSKELKQQIFEDLANHYKITGPLWKEIQAKSNKEKLDKLRAAWPLVAEPFGVKLNDYPASEVRTVIVEETNKLLEKLLNEAFGRPTPTPETAQAPVTESEQTDSSQKSPKNIENKKILLIGDSHMQGSLGLPLERLLRGNKAKVYNYAIGGSAAKTWINALNATKPENKKIFTHYNYEDPTTGKIRLAKNNREVKTYKETTWDEVRADGPYDYVIISLGTNDVSNESVIYQNPKDQKETGIHVWTSEARKNELMPQFINKVDTNAVNQIKQFSEKLGAKEETWIVGPPNMATDEKIKSDTKKAPRPAGGAAHNTNFNMSVFYQRAEPVFKEKLIDSRKVPKEDGDAVHYGGAGGKKWAKFVYDAFMQTSNNKGKPVPPPQSKPAEDSAPLFVRDEKEEQSYINASAVVSVADPKSVTGYSAAAADAQHHTIGQQAYGMTDEKADPAACAAANRMSEQAALILTMEEILDNIKNINGVSPQEREYKNFTTIRFDNKIDDKLTPTGHFFLTSLLTKSPRMKTFFSDLPPQVLSFLIPSIKLFKTFYDTRGKSYDWQIPFDDVPVSFKEATSQFVVQDPESVLNGNGNINAVGIKSFNYEFRGTNPAEIDTNIHASIELFFQNPSLLIKEISFDKKHPGFIVNPEEETINYKFAYSDLINSVERIDKITKLINDEYYRIKIQCGYANINESILTDILTSAKNNLGQAYSNEKIKEIITTIKETQVVLFLSPYSYDVSFKEDSTITLKIDFNASIDSIMSSEDSDIFMLSEETRDLKQKSDKFTKYLLALRDEQNIDKIPENEDNLYCVDLTKIKEVITKFEKEFPELKGKKEEEILEQLDIYRKKSYNILYSFFAGKETFSQQKREKSFLPKAYFARFNPELLNVGGSLNSASRAEKRVSVLTDKNKKQIYEVIEAFQDKEVFLGYASDKEREEAKEEFKKQDNEATSYLDMKMKQTLRKLKDGQIVYNVKFILLGDLIDIVLQTMNFINPQEHAPRFVLGNIPIKVPTKALQRIGKYSQMTAYREINPNLADIPISLNLLQEFLIKNIVKEKKTRYSALQFIKDIVSQLIFAAISPNVLGKPNAIASPIRLSTSYFTFPTSNGIDPISGISISERQYLPIINKERVDEIRKFRDDGKLFNSGDKLDRQKASAMKDEKTPFINYVFLTCSGRFPVGITGKEDDDIKNGLMHIRMGTDCGLVKKVDFKRVNIPGQREMLARREGEGRGTTLKQFYNASVSMFGNNIFRPGDFVYIHPNYIFKNTNGADANLDLEENLGLGGYYLVTNVKTNIGIASFDTSIECLHQAKVIQVQTSDPNKQTQVRSNDTLPCSDKT